MKMIRKVGAWYERWAVCLSAVCLLSCLSLSSVIAAEPADADVILEQLRAANQARQSAAQELSDWESEQQRLELLITESKRQQQQLQSGLERHQKAIAHFKQSLEQLDSQESQLLALDAVLLKLSKEIDAGLDQRSHDFPSSSISAKNTSAADAAMQFLRSSARLQQALNQSTHWQVSLSEGRLLEQTMVYDQLRMGNVCAWWASRDGQSGGSVKRENGENVLSEITDKQQVALIVEAIAIVRGDRAPQLMSLPLAETHK